MDEQKLQKLVERGVEDLGGAFHAGMMMLGDKLGLYRTLAQEGPMTSSELAERTETAERYVREWLASQAAGGYVTYETEGEKFFLTEEQAAVVADEDSPAYLPGGFQIVLAALRAEPKIREAFRTGEGVGWHEHDEDLYHGTDRFFRPNYLANLTSSWIPALEGVEEKLREGARVVDIGCGLGSSTIIMAQSYPASSFVGIDYHEPSIERARERAKGAGLGDRVRFEVASAKDFAARSFDFACCFDCLHDMGDPAGAAGHIREALADDGTWMIVEPFAGDRLEENLNPIGRVFYGASTFICTPASLDQEVGRALGAQAGEARVREVVQAGGFTRFRRATETPFNLVFEAKP